MWIINTQKESCFFLTFNIGNEMIYLIIGIICIFFIVVISMLLGWANIRYKLSYFSFIFSKEHRCYSEFKKQNKKESIGGLQEKKFSVIFKNESTKSDQILLKCGITNQNIIVKNEYPLCDVYLTKDYVLIIANTGEINSIKKIPVSYTHLTLPTIYSV